MIISFQPGQENAEISILLRDLENYNNDSRMCARKVSCCGEVFLFNILRNHQNLLDIKFLGFRWSTEQKLKNPDMSVRSASSNCFYGIKLDFTHFTLPFNVLIKKIYRFNANENE